MFKNFFLFFFISLVLISCGEDKTTDKKDLCKDVVCQNDGVCKEGKCDCKEGFTGENCETAVAVDICNPNPCKNNGICSSTTDAYTCDCANTGYEGDNCETEIAECTANSDCDDANSCTKDVCNQSKKCEHSFNTLPCDDGDVTTTSDTCKDGICKGISSETCTDGIKNQDETDIDCGGNTCSTCNAGENCNTNLDCNRGLSCTRGVCESSNA